MNFDNMNNQGGFERALEIIRRDSQNRPVFGCCQPTTNGGGGGTVGPVGPIGPTGATGPTGPTGATGATDTYDYFFNKINRNYSSLIPYKYINYEYIKK